MKIKNNISHVLFFDLFFGAIAVFFVSFGFFWGVEITKINFLIYLLTVLGIFIVCVLVYVLYMCFCRSYYVFLENELVMVEKNTKKSILNYTQIYCVKYYKFYNLFLGDPKGGHLIIFYTQQDGQKKQITISISLSLVKKTPLKNIAIK